MVLEFVLVVGGSVATAATAIMLEHRWRKRLEIIWYEAARLTGGRFVPQEQRLFKRIGARVISVVNGVEVVVDHHRVSTGKSQANFTRLHADAPGAGELDLRLRRENAVISVGKALGLGDIELGDPAFDKRYLVRANDPWMTCAWLDEGVRAAFLATPSEYEIHLHEGRIKAQRHGVEMHAEQLVAAMQAVAALARAGIELGRRWRELAASLGGRVSEAPFAPGLRFDAEHEGRRYAVETDEDRERGTRVRRELDRRDAPRFELAPGAALGDAAGGRDAAEDAWKAIQPAHLVCDGQQVIVSWPGYVPDAARLRAAFELLADVQTNVPGPYR